MSFKVDVEIDIFSSYLDPTESLSSLIQDQDSVGRWPTHGASPSIRRRGGWTGTGWTGNDDALARQAYAYWRGQGLTREQAIAVLGNQRGENALGSLNDAGGSGQFQWDARRRAQILAGTGIDVHDASFIDQQKAARWEMENSPDAINRVWGNLKGAGTSEEAVGLLVHQYERSLNQPSDISIRSGYARHYGRIVDGVVGGQGAGKGWNAAVGDIPSDVLAKVQKENPDLTPRQCVELVQSTMGVGNVHDWRRGMSAKEAPEGSALATFGQHGDSDLYAYGGSGTPGIGRDHALKMVKKYPDGSFDAVSQDINHPAHMIHMPWTGEGGEGDASSYFVINDKGGRPAGANAGISRRAQTPEDQYRDAVMRRVNDPSIAARGPGAPPTHSRAQAQVQGPNKPHAMPMGPYKPVTSEEMGRFLDSQRLKNEATESLPPGAVDVPPGYQEWERQATEQYDVINRGVEAEHKPGSKRIPGVDMPGSEDWMVKPASRFHPEQLIRPPDEGKNPKKDKEWMGPDV